MGQALAAVDSKRSLSVPSELSGLFSEVTNPYALAEKPPRKENEDLVEKIQSADGRWFDVEIIIFERTNNKPIRENFDQKIKNKQPKRFWDVQASKLQPNIKNLLANLPNCHADIDPFVVTRKRDEQGLSPLSPAEFFTLFNDYQTIIQKQWRLTNQLCLMPSESLAGFWSVSERVNYLPSPHQELYTDINWSKVPTKMAGYDYDDYRGVYLLDNANLKLTEQAQKLDNNWGTKTLLHLGWRQPGLAKNNAVSVYLKAGQNYTGKFTYDGYEITEHDSLSDNDFDDGITTPESLSSNQLMMSSVRSNVAKFLAKLESGAAVDPTTNTLVMPKRNAFPLQTWQLDGAITVHLDHYLYLDADFNFRQKMSKKVDVDAILAKESSLDAALVQNDLTNDVQNVLISAANKDKAVSEFNEFNESTERNQADDSLLEIQYLQNFPFKQLRRTYSGDLHYLDHPKYGVLFQIRKYRH